MAEQNLSSDVKLLFLSAMAIFMVTVVVGILNGTDLVEFTRSTLLTHVHAGTLGWITLSVFGAVIWLFLGREAADAAQASRIHWLTVYAILAVLLYVIAFYADIGEILPVVGSLVFVAIVAFLILAVVQSRKTTMTIPHVLILAAMINLTLGAIIGVLMGVGIALAEPRLLTVGAFIGHTSAMVIGYLILVGMAITEWRLVRPQVPASTDRLGLAQVIFPFVGGLTLIAGAIFDVFALIVLNVPFEIVGVAIYLVRIGRKIGHALWLGRGPAPLFGMSALFLVINIGVLVYLIVNYADRFEQIPLGLVFAMNHIMFIGVMTNALFGLVSELHPERQGVYPLAEWSIFGGMNVGLVGFAFGLVLDATILKILFKDQRRMLLSGN
ncbi:MAG: hypothetical protein ACE5JL_11575, partial [Dehalococcoidia bacterium]